MTELDCENKMIKDVLSNRGDKTSFFGDFIEEVIMADIFDKVKEIIVDKLGVDESAVKLEASFIEDLGADSLDIVDLVMALEEEFGIDIPDEEAQNIKSVGDAVNYIKNHQ